MRYSETLQQCELCPRACKVNRLENKTGICSTGRDVKAARAALHMWEEPCISGKNGSGTVFFSGCSLGCVFCQNKKISNGETGKEISIERLADIFINLQEKGAHNINLVTAAHVVPQVAEALLIAKNNGLTIPVLYNSGGYEKVSTLKLLDGLVDIYLPDFKFWTEQTAIRYAHAKHYPAIAKMAIEEMSRQVKQVKFDENGMIRSGMVVRHLVLPGCVSDAKSIIRYLYHKYHDDIYISIMSQYTPVGDLSKFPEINRKLTKEEYEDIIEFAIDLGIENAYIQEGDTADESFIPQFDCEGI